MPADEEGTLVTIGVQHLVTGGFQGVIFAQEYPFGLLLDVNCVVASLFETSTTPDFVLLFLRVGTVCPNCQSHIVTLFSLTLPWVKMNLSDQWESYQE